MTWTFNGPKNEYTTVEAETERQARHKAMVERWGPPSGMYSSPYSGLGLDLVSKE